jgi:hypothetical protein
MRKQMRENVLGFCFVFVWLVMFFEGCSEVRTDWLEEAEKIRNQLRLNRGFKLLQISDPSIA